MNLSFWEKQACFSGIDFCVVGSGLVGLSCALQLKKTNPRAKVLLLERGVLPTGASTKNAGFACFGSLSEILSDLKSHTEEEVFDLVEQRYKGLKLLRETIGDQRLGYHNFGGYEVFSKDDKALFEACKAKINEVNKLLNPIFKRDLFRICPDKFNFDQTYNELIFNSLEGQLNVGQMMQNLLHEVHSEGVIVLNNIEVQEFDSDNNNVTLKLEDFEFKAKHLFIATNAFAKQLIDVNLSPARNQVLITEPIKNLDIKGVFHLNEGYYYFRNVGNRILLGGGRHLSQESETTVKFETTSHIQNALEKMLHNVILSSQDVKIEHRWSGILGVGEKKKPILKSLNNRVHCAVRLGGMGVAIGSILGRNLADLIRE